MKNTAIIIRDKELIEKVDKLKKFFGYRARTKFIQKLINVEFNKYRMVYGEFEFDNK